MILSRTCPDHGAFEAVVYGDADRYLEIQRFDKPGQAPLERQTETAAGCPHDCGICPEHAQHTCLGIIEVNGTGTSSGVLSSGGGVTQRRR